MRDTEDDLGDKVFLKKLLGRRAKEKEMEIGRAKNLKYGGSTVVAYGLSCFVACEIFLDQGLNPCLLQWQVNLPLSHQGSPCFCFR